MVNIRDSADITAFRPWGNSCYICYYCYYCYVLFYHWSEGRSVDQQRGHQSSHLSLSNQPQTHKPPITALHAWYDSVGVSSEVDVGDLHVSLDLKHVHLGEGLQPVGVVKQMLAVDKHLEALVPAANRHLETNSNRRAGSEPGCFWLKGLFIQGSPVPPPGVIFSDF